MGKASSSKKVQKAARAASASSVNQRKLGFPAAVVGVIVVGVALVAVARAGLDASDLAPRIGDDHWHAAYGIYTCDTFEAPLVDQGEDREGIHTHGDGAMHVHPFTANASGDNARLDRWAEQVGLDFGDDSFTLPDGRTFTNGDDCGGTPGEVVVARWDDALTVDSQDPDVVLRSDFGSLRYVQDASAILIGFVPEGADLPKVDITPLANLADIAPEDQPLTQDQVGGLTPSTSAPDSTAPATTEGEGGARTTVPSTTAAPSTSAAPTTTAAP